MPIKVANNLPAIKILEEENIFVMPENRAISQDIRPLRIVILNIMPTKIETETQLIRLLGNTSLQVDVELLHMKSHSSKNISQQHLDTFYKTFDEIKNNRYDGLIITGAPVEHMEFEDVDYWEELTTIMDWAKKNVWSTLHICWGAQAGMYHYYGINKRELPKKISGIYRHRIKEKLHPLLRGLDDVFMMPHSRYTECVPEEILANNNIEILAESEKAGIAIVADKPCRKFFIFGHAEYDRMTLAQEYERDLKKGIVPEIPYSYFPKDDVTKTPDKKWRSTAFLLFGNWLNYFVYQQTPYDLTDLDKNN
ncbi:MAG: homoserine O-succinyltransferase [Oscillospiraceae bacterium]|nr:homoserine O-succinyltransferase [Oscillospiraceae bacterium]